MLFAAFCGLTHLRLFEQRKKTYQRTSNTLRLKTAITNLFLQFFFFFIYLFFNVFFLISYILEIFFFSMTLVFKFLITNKFKNVIKFQIQRTTF